MMEWTGYETKTLCVAVSGGVDSVVLLHQMKALQKNGAFSLCAVHCEHGIRGEESVADMQFVKELCQQWGVPLFVYSADCPALARERGESLETAARNFRYGVFESLLKEGKAEYIVLAHHRADEAETVLFRLARGCSLSGVSAMKEKDGRYLRPLLGTDKAEIIAYAKEHGLCWREDKTNAEECATRNKLRLRVLPALEEAVSGAGKNLASFATLAAEDDALLYELADELIETVEPRSAKDTGYRVKASAQKPLFTRACLTVLKRLGVEKDYTRETLDGLFALQGLQTGSERTVKQGVIAVREYEKIAFYRAGNGTSKEKEIPFQTGCFRVGRYEVIVSEKATDGWKIDGDKVPAGAVLRTKRSGDEFTKFGGGSKPLKKYLVDKKIAAAERAELPVLAVGKEVLAVFGVEISEKVKLTEETKRILYLSVKK